MGVVVHRMGLDHRLELGRGLGELPVAEVGAPQRLADRALLRRLPRRLGERHRCLLEVAVLEQLHATSIEVVERLGHVGRVYGRPMTGPGPARRAARRPDRAPPRPPLLRGERHLVLAVALDDRDLVALGVEADLGARYVVEDDRVEALALELPARPFDRVLARARPRTRPASAPASAPPRALRSRPRSPPGAGSSPPLPARASLPRGERVGRKSATAAAIKMTCDPANAARAARRARCRLDADHLDRGDRRGW